MRGKMVLMPKCVHNAKPVEIESRGVIVKSVQATVSPDEMVWTRYIKL